MIVIIGAGLTGLACAHHLSARGVPYLVLEAAARPGGVIRSGRVRGHLLEWGPQRTRLTETIRELIELLGLEDEVITSRPGLPLYVYREGRLRRVPFSAAEFLRTDLLSWSGKLRVLAEPLGAPARDDESVADFFVRKIGREAYENLVGPLYGGLYASDPARMRVGLSLGHVLREFGIGRSLIAPLLRRGGRIEPPPACSFREGMETLPRALHERYREHVRLETPVRRLARESGGYVVETEGETLHAEQVVLTSSAPSTALILRETAPEAAERIGRLVYNPLVVVHVHADTDLVGLGYQVSFSERMITRGVTFNDSLFGRTGVYTVYLGGAKAPQVRDWTDQRLIETAVREFREATGFDAEALAVERERMPAWDQSWAALEGLRLPEGLHIAANWESRPGIPGRLLRAKRLAAQIPVPAGASSPRPRAASRAE
jgi:protoporphyrinogen/coproporphyrinogen III oxidase